MKIEVALVLLSALAATPLAASDLFRSPSLPNDQLQMAQRAATAFNARRYDEAAAAYHAIIETHPEALYAWSNLGVTRFQQRHFDEARDAFEQALKLNPKDAICLSDLGVVDFELKDYRAAIKQLKAVLMVNPEDAATHGYLGYAYEKISDRSDSLIELKKANTLQSKEGSLENAGPRF